MGEIDDVVGPLSDQLGVEDRRGVGAEYPEGLVADLPAVAVRAVEQVLSPALPDTGDVRELVADPGGNDDAAGRQHFAVAAVDGEAGVDASDDVIDDLDAVAGDLVSTGREQLGRWHPVVGQVAVHVGGRGIAW